MADLVRRYATGKNSPRPVPATSSKSFYSIGGNKDVPEWVVIDDYRSCYYSGLDISVYFGEIFVDEVVQLQYQETEQVRALFGYDDYLFRDVVHGSRIVQGSFATNFKDAGYIATMLNMLADPADQARAMKTIAWREDYFADNRASTPEETAQYLEEQRTWSARRIALATDVTLEELLNTRMGIGGYNPAMYPALMDDLKKLHWGDAADATTAELAEELAAQSLSDSPKYTVPRTDQGFDIVVKYGQPEDYDQGRPGWGTIERLRDCHIMTASKAIDDSGRNILEMYTFLARTLD